ncbi:MAG: serine protease [Granulosicoccus sp.]|nr:serine protease [Granulosicoccus sp.]
MRSTDVEESILRVKTRLRGWWTILWLCGFLPLSVDAASNQLDFSGYYEQIYQIRVVSQNAGSKSSIGSGFQVTANGLIITNYHVVSEYVQNPDHYEIRFAEHDGETGVLELLDFDIVNDLAVLRHPDPSKNYFSLAQEEPNKGEIAYALGNPGDWGIVMVSGPTNGQVEHSFKDTILFSGSLNSGMSGGPSINRSGDVIGVNVATAGSQLSFLVPVEKVKNLLMRSRTLDSSEYQLQIARQIRSWQLIRTDGLINSAWKEEKLLDRDLVGEIRSDFQCWGGSNESDAEREIEWVSKWCEAGDEIYVSSDVDAGQISYYFTRRRPVTLNAMQFTRLQKVGMRADNSTNFENSTNYLCTTNFLNQENQESGSYTRIVTCIRAFKKYPGLYDSLLLIQQQSSNEVFEAHVSLSAMQKTQIQAINKRFAEYAL